MTATGSMTSAHGHHRAALLPDGRVLVAAGYGPPGASISTSSDLYNPASGTFSPANEADALTLITITERTVISITDRANKLCQSSIWVRTYLRPGPRDVLGCQGAADIRVEQKPCNRGASRTRAFS